MKYGKRVLFVILIAAIIAVNSITVITLVQSNKSDEKIRSGIFGNPKEIVVHTDSGEIEITSDMKEYGEIFDAVEKCGKYVDEFTNESYFDGIYDGSIWIEYIYSNTVDFKTVCESKSITVPATSIDIILTGGYSGTVCMKNESKSSAFNGFYVSVELIETINKLG